MKGLRLTPERFAELQAQNKVKVGVLLGGKTPIDWRPTESQEQTRVIQWADGHPLIRGRLFAIPNGANKSKAGAAKFKREGLRSGIPDLMLPIPRNGFHGLFVEMKREKGSVTSFQQHEWIEFLTLQGYKAVICKGADEAIRQIEEYLA